MLRHDHPPPGGAQASASRILNRVTTFDDVSGTLEAALAGSMRAEIVREASSVGTLGAALLHLRQAMRSHVWRTSAAAIDLERAVQRYDRRTRHVGFHVLNDWDGIADRVNEDTIPVDVLNYLVDLRGSEPARPRVLAILLDYYFMHLLALLSVRVWDEGDADTNMETVGRLLAHLQGPDGSGQRFAADPETLLLIATSHYELHERGYQVLLEMARTLGPEHQLRIALGHAVSMGCHLRFGFEATYGRDTVNMRDDNVADYPWLCFALTRLIREYVRLRREAGNGASRAMVVEALLNGLSADARAFIGQPPASLSRSEAERAQFRDLFLDVRQDLLAEFEQHRPTTASYSPLCFFFNFSHNVVKGVVIDGLLNDRPCPLTFNDLLTGVPADAPHAALKAEMAVTLMGYARDNPHRIRGRLRPVIVYDVQSGREAFSVAMRKMKG
jgi:hypothetical protein